MKEFITKDFYLSSALMANNYKLVDYFRKAGFTTFVFEETNKLKEYVKDYYSESTLIEPVAHGRAIKNLKSLIHSISSSTSKPHHNNGNNNFYKGTI